MKKNNKFTLGAVLSGKEGSVHHRKSNMTVSGSKFAFGVVKLFFQTKPGQNLYSQTLSESLCNVGYSLDWCTRGGAGHEPGWRVVWWLVCRIFWNLYGMQGCNHTNLLFLCDVTEPKTGQTQFHPLYSPTNRYIKIYNKFNKFINLFNKFS